MSCDERATGSFDDTHSIPSESTQKDPPRASIGGLSLLGQFPFDFAGVEQEALPDERECACGAVQVSSVRPSDQGGDGNAIGLFFPG